MVELIEKELVHKIVGCAITVANELGHGLREKTYEKALCIELKRQNLSFSQQMSFPVYYDNQLIDEYIPDLIVEDKVIVETKNAGSILDEHRGQVLNYLRITKKEVGIILNFKHPRLQWERLILTKNK
ncbi:MAG: GxxExxY protein [Candidatus Neomarinimicrobiota bacterium]